MSETVKKFLRHCTIVFFAFFAMGLLASLALNMTFLSPIAHTMSDFSLTDIYYHVQQEYGRVDTSRVITIVDMTDLSERSQIADAYEEIMALSPKAVGVDVVYEGLKQDSISDMKLMELADKYPNAVYSYRMLDYVNDTIGYTNEIHSFFSGFTGAKEGFTNFERTLYGGLKRKASLRRPCMGEERTSLVYEVAKLYSEGKLIDNGKTDVSVNFRPTEFRIVPSDSIRYYKDLIKDHVVLFGAMNELADMHYTPLGEMAGVKLLAYSIQTLLEQTEVRHLPGWLTAIISFIIVLVTYLWRKGYMKWAKSNKSEWMRFFLTSTFVVGIVLFIWSAFLVWLTFLIFMTTDISINLGWAMAAIPFIGGAGEFYGLTLRRCFG